MNDTTASPPQLPITMLSGTWFVASCALIACGTLLIGRVVALPLWLLASEVLATILGLFLLGSFTFQIHKNALTYGMLLIIDRDILGLATSAWHAEIAERGWWLRGCATTCCRFAGSTIVHADTMLFILGLTFFVSVIAQTRLLEGITFFLLRRNRGHPADGDFHHAGGRLRSGVLDGVSMIGLDDPHPRHHHDARGRAHSSVRYAVMVCTAVTTICGIWLAYGEPPNLIMKANLYPYLDNAFFLRYCAPAAVPATSSSRGSFAGSLAVNTLIWTTWTSSMRMRRMCDFFRRRATARCMTPIELIEGTPTDLEVGRLRSWNGCGVASRSASL